MYYLATVARYKTALLVAAAIAMAVILVPQMGYAAEDTFGLGNVRTGLTNEAGDVTLGERDLRETVGQIINVALSLLGIIAVVIILIGGFRWMTAGGNDEKVTEARKWIFSGIIGLAVILSAWAIATFVLKQLSTATGSGTFAEPAP